MRKFEKIIGAIFFLALLSSFLKISGSVLIVILAGAIISMYYFYGGILIFNNVRIKDALKKDAFKGVSGLQKTLAVFSGFALSTAVLGIMFKSLMWIGSSIMIGIALCSLLVLLLISLIQYNKNKTSFYRFMLFRLAFYGSIVFVLFLIPKTTILEIKFSEHPEYIEAVKKSWEDPTNFELKKKVEEEMNKLGRK